MSLVVPGFDVSGLHRNDYSSFVYDTHPSTARPNINSHIIAVRRHFAWIDKVDIRLCEVRFHRRVFGYAGYGVGQNCTLYCTSKYSGTELIESRAVTGVFDIGNTIVLRK